MKGDYKEHYDSNARLIILKTLAEQNDYRLNDRLLLASLEVYAINKGINYVRNQLTWLENEAGAITIKKMGSTFISELTEAGLDHVERRQVLVGVARPSPAV